MAGLWVVKTLPTSGAPFVHGWLHHVCTSSHRHQATSLNTRDYTQFSKPQNERALSCRLWLVATRYHACDHGSVSRSTFSAHVTAAQAAQTPPWPLSCVSLRCDKIRWSFHANLATTAISEPKWRAQIDGQMWANWRSMTSHRERGSVERQAWKSLAVAQLSVCLVFVTGIWEKIFCWSQSGIDRRRLFYFKPI